jgi:PAT family beta-lactamase induction signal transducer AmpG
MHRDFPVLQQSRWLRFFTLCVLYAAQGLPVGLFQVAIPAWFAAEGLSLGQIGGFIAIVFLPWSFKLFAGPVMDKFSFPPMGRRRPWVLGAQSGLVLAFLVMMLLAPDPAESYYLLAALGFACNFFGALQDVAVDGMAIDILEEDERAQANAYMYGGQIAGISAASAVGGAALMNFGLAAAAGLMAFTVLLIMLVPVLLRERPGERMLPWNEGEASPEALVGADSTWMEIASTLTRSLILPMSILLILLEGLSRAATGIVVAINPVVAIQELGWIQTDYSNWVAVTGIVAALLGVAVGPVVDRVGAQLTLGLIIGFRVLMYGVFGLMSHWWSSPEFFQAFIMASAVSGQIVTIAIISLFMRLCFRQVAATQFAVYMASANLTLSLGSALVAPLGSVFNYQEMYYFVAALNLAFLALLPMLNFERHERALATL